MRFFSNARKQNAVAHTAMHAQPTQAGASAQNGEGVVNTVAESVPPTRRRNRLAVRILMHVIGWPIVVLLLVALFAEGAMLLLLFGEQDYSGRIYPNISVRGVDLSNQSETAAYALLQQRYDAFLDNPIVIRYGDQTWHPTAQELGIELDFDGAIQEAMSVGRTSHSRVDNTRAVADVWENGVELPLNASVNQHAMQEYLRALADTIESPAQNADVSLDPEQANIVITPEEPGLQVLVDETMHDMTAQVQHLETREVKLRTRLLHPVVRDADVAPVIAQLNSILSEPIRIVSADENCLDACRWEWSPQHIVKWVKLNRTVSPNGVPQIDVQVDQTAIRNALVPVAAAVRQEGTLPRLSWNNGTLSILQPGLTGQGLDVEQAQTLINEALHGGPRNLGMPLITLPPPVNETNLSSLNIREPVGIGVSSFRNSQQYRITNIQAGARRLNGILIPPGGEFSFNDNLGVVDASGGFVQGSAIVNNRTQQEWGGGLCQVSTTMFRAAFWGGLPVTERHEHDFRIGWYEELGEPPGLDAAIYTGALDLRFLNNTDGWLLVQTYVNLSRQQLTIILYGKPINRTVNMDYRIIKHIPRPNESVTVEDPTLPRGTYKQTDWAQPGLVVEVYRDVWQNGALIRRDTFPTTFNPWPNIFVRGTGR